MSEDDVDGRTLRRDRNRDAVLDATLDLLQGGVALPTVAQIAERSSVSHRSVFRYFEDSQNLFQEASQRAFERFAPFSVIRNYGRGTFAERVSALADQRVALFRAIAPIVASARVREGGIDALEEGIGAHAEPLRSQIEVQFAPELKTMEQAVVTELVTALHAMLSFEAFEFLTRVAVDTDDEVRRLYRFTIETMVGAHQG